MKYEPVLLCWCLGGVSACRPSRVVNIKQVRETPPHSYSVVTRYHSSELEANMDFDPFGSLSSDKDPQLVSSDPAATDNKFNEEAPERVDPFSWSEPGLGGEEVMKDADSNEFNIVNESPDFDKKSDNDGLAETSVLSQPCGVPGSLSSITETETDISQTPAGLEAPPQMQIRKVIQFHVDLNNHKCGEFLLTDFYDR